MEVVNQRRPDRQRRRSRGRHTALALGGAAFVVSLAAASSGNLPWQNDLDSIRAQIPGVPPSKTFAAQGSLDGTAYATTTSGRYCIARRALATGQLLAPLTCATPQEFDSAGGLASQTPPPPKGASWWRSSRMAFAPSAQAPAV